MKISACIIAKNEEANIGCCLDSLCGQVDEVIVVDTGSKDRTIAIAKEKNAIVIEYSWENDFSKARNYALQQASGEWIIFLDADETLWLEKAHSLKKMLNKIPTGVEVLLTKLINIDVDQNNAVQDYFYTMRIFRNFIGLHYVGSIHERLQKQDKAALNFVKIDAMQMIIYHTGYSSLRIQEKSKRNIKLLQERLLTGEKAVHLYRHLAESYAALEQYQSSLQYLRQAHAMPQEITTYQSRYYQLYLTALKECGCAETAEFFDILIEALQACPELPDFHAEYAVYLYQSGRYDTAKDEIELAIQLHKNYAGMEPSFFDEQIEKAEFLRCKINQQISADQDEKIKCDSDLLLLGNKAKETLSRALQALFFYFIMLDDGEKCLPLIHLLPNAMQDILKVYYKMEHVDKLDIDLYQTLKKDLEYKLDKRRFAQYLVIEDDYSER